MSDSFHWHPEARLFDATGAEVHAENRQRRRPVLGKIGGVLAMSAETGVAVFKDNPQGLAQAIGHPAFRIGGLDQSPPDPHDQPVFETLTSGSTSLPRRVRRTQASWTASFEVNARFGIGPGARVATLGRLVHSLALYGAIEGLHLGAEVHLLDGIRPDRLGAALSQRRITHLYATPAQLRQFADRSDPCPDLCLIFVGGSKLDPALRAGLATLGPNAQIREFYGAAETSFITLADEVTPDSSVGSPYPGVDLRLDPSGDVWVKSPYIFLGYADPAFHLCPDIPAGGTAEPEARPSRAEAKQAHCAPALNSTAPTTRWRDGWLSVGEIGELKAGYLYLKGRAGRMVTVADRSAS